MCMDRNRKAERKLKLHLARNAENDNNGSFRYGSQKRKVEDSIHLS